MEWISVKNRLPPVGERVLCDAPEGITIAQYCEGEPDSVDSMGFEEGFVGHECMTGRSFGNPEYYRDPFNQPTHWMPLPEPPQVEGE